MTSNIGESWNRIISWLAANAPAARIEVSAPATESQIADAVSRMGLTLPSDVIEFYLLLNGAKECSVFPSNDYYDDMAFTPMSLDEVIDEWEGQKELIEIGQFDDCTPNSSDGVANDWWNLGWIPIADNGAGDYFCIDTAPTRGGSVGQVISHSHETGEHCILASSLAVYLNDLANRLDLNEFVYDDYYGVKRSVGELDDEAEDRIGESPQRPSLWHLEKVALPAATEAFREKDYQRCVEILTPFVDVLDKVASAKLAFAQKKST